MELQEILALMDRFEASSAVKLELELGELRLKLERGAAATAAAPVFASVPSSTPARAEEGTLVRAPLVGTFYAAPAPGEPPFVSVGDHVEKGQTLCVLEAMKMMSEVPAPVSGELVEILAEDGALIGFDTPLFRIRER